MSRLLGDTMLVRLLLLVAACVALGGGLMWFASKAGSDGEVPREFHGYQVAERIAGTTLAIEAAPPTERERIATRASGLDYTLHWTPDSPPPTPANEATFALRRAIAQAMQIPATSLQIGKLGPGLFALPLADGSALRIAVSPSLSFREVVPSTVPLALFAASALLICFLAARRAARGMARFAETADHFGRAATAQKLELTGPREVRAAITAFNAMQARIERIMAERTAMLGALSHDLRTPLARLRLRAEFMGDPREQLRMLHDLDEMGAMVSQSLEFLRDDSRAEPATRLDLAVLLQGIAEEQADLGHAVIFRGPDHATIRARPLSLKRALSNIVENAVKFGSRAEIELKLDDGAVAVAVSDDGPGIPETLRERVFEPFFRAEPSRNRDTGGVGLGLSIARTVVRGHGGDIRLSDHALGGLIVRVELPA